MTIHTNFLPRDDPDASLAFYQDTLGFEVRNDVGKGNEKSAKKDLAALPED